MAKSTLTTPGAGYAYGENQKDVQAGLIAMGVKPASPDSMAQTMAVSRVTPGVVVPGATTGSTPSGQGVAPVQTQIQAITGNNGSKENQAFLDQQAYLARTKNGTDLTKEGAQPAAPVVTPNSQPGVSSGNLATNATAGQVYSGIGAENADLQSAYDAQGNLIKATQGPIDEQAIREATLAKFQTQISALDRYYAEQLKKKQAAEQLANQGRLGTNAAVQARRGTIGSDFGNAQTDVINQNSQEIQNSIADQVNAEREMQIQALLGNARKEADAEIAAKQAAKTKGAQDYIDFLKGAAERKDQRVQSALANVIASNLQEDETTLKTLASQLGLGIDEIKSRLKTAKATAAADAAKNAPKPIEVNGVLYQAQADGSYKAVTPVAEEKPIVVGGVAYSKQADGSYKAITPKAEVKPINRVVNKVLQVSLDGGITWAPAKGGAAPTVPARRSSGGGSTKVSVAQATRDMTKQLSTLTGSDGFVSPDTYLVARNEWIGSGLNPTEFDNKMKGFVNPNNANYITKKQ